MLPLTSIFGYKDSLVEDQRPKPTKLKVQGFWFKIGNLICSHDNRSDDHFGTICKVHVVFDLMFDQYKRTYNTCIMELLGRDKVKFIFI